MICSEHRVLTSKMAEGPDLKPLHPNPLTIPTPSTSHHSRHTKSCHPEAIHEDGRRTSTATPPPKSTYNPNPFHIPATRAFVSSSIKISSGHGRANPSLAHFRVASTPIFDPKSCSRDAWSNVSVGPNENCTSRSGSSAHKAFHTTSL